MGAGEYKGKTSDYAHTQLVALLLLQEQIFLVPVHGRACQKWGSRTIVAKAHLISCQIWTGLRKSWTRVTVWTRPRMMCEDNISRAQLYVNGHYAERFFF